MILAPVILVEMVHVLNLKKGTHVIVQQAFQAGIVTKVAQQALLRFFSDRRVKGSLFDFIVYIAGKKSTRFKPRKRAVSL